jgi:hypothetical protein
LGKLLWIKTCCAMNVLVELQFGEDKRNCDFLFKDIWLGMSRLLDFFDELFFLC